MFFNYKSDFLKFILGWQDKISGSKQLMRPQPCVTGVNCQEESMLKEKLESKFGFSLYDLWNRH